MFNVTRYIKQLVLSEFRGYLSNDMTAGNAEDLLRNLSKKMVYSIDYNTQMKNRFLIQQNK